MCENFTTSLLKFKQLSMTIKMDCILSKMCNVLKISVKNSVCMQYTALMVAIEMDFDGR